MDYEKRYKEANDKVAVRFGTNVAKEIFTDLYESEDERIRKEITELVMQPTWKTEKEFHRRLELCVWLKKQGEKKVSYTTLAETGNGGINALVTKELPTNGCNEQKPVNDTDEDIVEAVKDTSIIDLVESKFHEGEWVVQEKIGVYKVIEVCESWYEVVDNKDKHYSIGFDKEYMCHLWTIQDAREGDVLATDDGNICVFDGTVEDGKYPFAYCGLTRHRFEFYDRRLPFTHDNIHPATKEQRELLFTKMKEEGYGWDANKKEPKKIITPIFNVGDTIIKKNNSDINKFGQFTITDITGGKYWYNDRIICDISEQYEWELVEQKPISFDTSTPVSYDDIPFGEKDYELHEATYFIPEGFRAEIEGDKVIIKRGEQKPAWSEEDERICRAIICDIANDKSICKFEISKSICDEQINWLKSLKERIGG